MKSDIILRDASVWDETAIQALTLAAYEEYAHALGAEGWEAYKSNILETLSHVAPAEQIVAERGREIVGAVLLYPKGSSVTAPDGTSYEWKTPEVRLLAVPPGERGQGVGSALMQECLARARRAGVPALALHTTDLMQVAMQMYEGMGFVRDPENDFEPAPGIVIKGYRYALV